MKKYNFVKISWKNFILQSSQGRKGYGDVICATVYVIDNNKCLEVKLFEVF